MTCPTSCEIQACYLQHLPDLGVQKKMLSSFVLNQAREQRVEAGEEGGFEGRDG